MRFPYREPEILRLATDIAAGLAANAEEFPAAPYSPEDFETALSTHDGNREAQFMSRAAAMQATAAKDESLGVIADMSKSVLRYAENHTRCNDSTLRLLGWGRRRARTQTVKEPPGQARTLEIIREGPDWVYLDWKEPMDGGQVAAYRLQRRKREGGDWTDVGMSVDSEITLNGQDTGIEYEYRVMAVNSAGESPASNIVRAVL
jgi:hypothetical protein